MAKPIKARILCLFSDVGGGHRSATEATVAALERDYGDRVTVEMVDALKDYAPLPFSRMSELYPKVMTRSQRVWSMTYHATDGRRRKALIDQIGYLYSRRNIEWMLSEHPADLIVSFHLGVNGVVMNSLEQQADRPRFATVVTDLVTAHSLWFDERADLCIVATQHTAKLARQAGLAKDRVKVLGLPVNRQFRPVTAKQKTILRQQAGLDQTKQTVLLIGGGEGMGGISRIAKYLDRHLADIELIIICGRNRALYQRMKQYRWFNHPKIYGFTREMPELMQMADVLVTKAGPSTLCEAMNSHLPVIIYDYLPGQEEDNVTYILQEGAGAWAPTPSLIAQTLTDWQAHPKEYNQVKRQTKHLANPKAATDVAKTLVSLLGL